MKSSLGDPQHLAVNLYTTLWPVDNLVLVLSKQKTAMFYMVTFILNRFLLTQIQNAHNEFSITPMYKRIKLAAPKYSYYINIKTNV